MHILILAGGEGTRLWPLSKQNYPKQFLRFGDPHSLLQKTVLRFLNTPFTKSISIVSSSQHLPLIEQQLIEIDAAKQVGIIVEPARRNTAPAIAFGVKFLQETGKVEKEECLLILPSDHLIEPQSVFLDYVQAIQQIARHHLILFGICPTKPEVGYGYIQMGDRVDEFTHQVNQFVEKPNLETAKQYLATQNYYWNSGIVACSIHHFWHLLQENAPDIAALLNGKIEEAILRFPHMPHISFDYAVLEKCKNALMCPLPITWSDVGCWDSVYEVSSKDENQNVTCGPVLALNTKNSLIIGNKKLIATMGVEDLFIIETEEALFICKKGESQKVKQVIQMITCS